MSLPSPCRAKLDQPSCVCPLFPLLPLPLQHPGLVKLGADGFGTQKPEPLAWTHADPEYPPKAARCPRAAEPLP